MIARNRARMAELGLLYQVDSTAQQPRGKGNMGCGKGKGTSGTAGKGTCNRGSPPCTRARTRSQHASSNSTQPMHVTAMTMAPRSSENVSVAEPPRPMPTVEEGLADVCPCPILLPPMPAVED